MNYLREKAQEREALATSLQTIIDTAATESREFSDTEAAQVQELEKRLQVLDATIETVVRTNEGHEHFQDLMRRAAGKRQEQKDTRLELTAGELFTRAPEIQAWTGRGQSPMVEVDTRALVKTDTFGEPDPSFSKLYSVADRFRLFDVSSKLYISGGSFTYFVEELAGESGGPIAEGTARPEFAVNVTKVEASLQTFGSYKKVSREFWQDEQGALATIVQNKLQAGVVNKLNGVIATALSGVATTPVTHATGLIEAVRLGIAEVEVNGGTASFVLVHPSDYAAMDIAVYGTTLNGPSAGQSPWGLPVVTDAALTPGTAYVIDRDAYDLYMRNQVTMYMTDSDISGAGSTAASDFQAGIITLAAEARARVAIGQPALIVPCEKSGAAARSSK